MAGKCGYHKVKQEAQHVTERGLLGWQFKGPGKHRLVCKGARIPDFGVGSCRGKRIYTVTVTVGACSEHIPLVGIESDSDNWPEVPVREFGPLTCNGVYVGQGTAQT